WITNGYLGDIAVGDIRNTQPGFMKGPVLDGILSRIWEHITETWSDHPVDSPRRVVLPIVSDFPNGADGREILAFGEFFINRVYDGNGVEVPWSNCFNPDGSPNPSAVTGSQPYYEFIFLEYDYDVQ
ncbi:MAG: hypothetical protein AB1765_01950, partial [Candidatus Hydrogenedentota bacterium]